MTVNQNMGTLWGAGGAVVALASAMALLGAAGAAQADTLCIQNNAAFGNGPIVTVDCTTGTFVNSFVSDQAKIGSNNGRGVAVLGNFVYYTELTGNGFGPSTGIFVAPFNNGAGGHDITSFPNPVPGTGIVDLTSDNMGHLFAMTGYNAGPEVVQETDGNGNNIGAQVTLHTTGGANLTDSDGFAILPNGNWLINTGDAINSYNQFNPVTGMEIPGTTIMSHTTGGVACASSTGVDTDGTNLYFDCNFNSIVEDTLAGVFIGVTSTLPNGTDGEDISLVAAAPVTPPSGAPEPASLSVLGAALVGFGMLRRRNRLA
jgi:hypothetical protein